MWNEIEIASHEHHTTSGGEPSPPNGAVGEFIPEREVEINAFDDFSHHHHCHRGKSFPVVASHEVFQHVDIRHHEQKGCQCEDDEILHRSSVGGAIIPRLVILCGCKHKRFVGIAEGLCDERHDHGNLHRSAINAELHTSFCTRHEPWEDDFVDGLVQNTCNAKHQHGPRVRQHWTDERAVHAPAHTKELFPKSEGDEPCADEVDKEHVSHFDLPTRHHVWKNNEVKKIEQDVERDKTQFEGGKLERTLQIAQIAEGDCLKSIESHDGCHHEHVVVMIGIAHLCGNGVDERPH